MPDRDAGMNTNPDPDPAEVNRTVDQLLQTGRRRTRRSLLDFEKHLMERETALVRQQEALAERMVVLCEREDRAHEAQRKIRLGILGAVLLWVAWFIAAGALSVAARQQGLQASGLGWTVKQ